MTDFTSSASVRLPSGCIAAIFPQKPIPTTKAEGCLLIEGTDTSFPQHRSIINRTATFLRDVHQLKPKDACVKTCIDIVTMAIGLALVAASHVPEGEIEVLRASAGAFLNNVIDNENSSYEVPDNLGSSVAGYIEKLEANVEEACRAFKGKPVKQSALIFQPTGVVPFEGRFAPPRKTVSTDTEAVVERRYVDAVLQSDRKLRFLGGRKSEWIHFSPEEAAQVSLAARALADNVECEVTLRVTVNDKGDEIVVLEDIRTV